MVAALSEAERLEALADLPAWTYDADRKAIFRRVELADFSVAMGAMTRIALAAEKADHHPEWFNVYNRIDIWLTTHDAGGVSGRDMRLAREIDEIVPSLSRE